MSNRLTGLRSRNKSSEQERHEFSVIDAAVRGAGTNQPEDAVLTDFALRISDARSMPNDGFYRELDERFGAHGDSSQTAVTPRGFSPLVTGGGVLASVLIVAMIVVGVSAIGSRDDGDTMAMNAISGTASDASSQAAAAPASKDSVAEGLTKAAPATRGEFAPGAARKVAQTADLTLATRGSNVETVADGVIRTTDKFGGYVGNSSVTGGDASNAGAHFELKIPAAKFQAALAEMSSLAHVRTRTQNTEDVTAPYSRARSRLTVARAQRDRLVTKYAAAEPGSSEAAALKTQLARAEARVDARGADLKRLQNRVNFVGMGVEVAADSSAIVPDSRGTIHRAADTAVNVLTAIAAALLIALAAALPIALVGGAIWFGATRSKRRRRNSVLDEAAA